MEERCEETILVRVPLRSRQPCRCQFEDPKSAKGSKGDLERPLAGFAKLGRRNVLSNVAHSENMLVVKWERGMCASTTRSERGASATIGAKRLGKVSVKWLAYMVERVVKLPNSCQERQKTAQTPVFETIEAPPLPVEEDLRGSRARLREGTREKRLAPCSSACNVNQRGRLTYEKAVENCQFRIN